MLKATRATCSTRRTSTIARCATTSLTSTAFLARPECAWITREIEQRAMNHLIAEVVPKHDAEVRSRRLAWIAKTRAAVHDRLRKEIIHWDHEAAKLKDQEAAGKPNARLNAQEARRRADSLDERLKRRLSELDREAQISTRPPVVLGGMMVVPAGLIAAITGRPAAVLLPDRQAVAAKARRIVMEVERGLGFDPVDREFERLGYDIESRDPRSGRALRFIEVKGRSADAATVTVTKNEVLYSLNMPDSYILALVEFHQDGGHRVRYLRRPFRRQPDFGATSVNYDFSDLLARSEAPS